VVSEYQKRMAEVAKYSDVELTLLVPKYWLQFNKRVNLEKNMDDHYRILSIQPITWGFRKSTFCNVTHFYPHIKEILKNFKPEIIELWEEPFSLVATHTIFWAKRLRPLGKIIFFSAQNIDKRYPLPFSLFEKYTHKNTHFGFLMNDEVARIVRKKGYNKEFRVLPLGVDEENFCNKDVSSLKKKLGLQDFVIGFIGKICKEKGISDLIKAVSKINREIQLLIIGNGELREEIKDLIKLLSLQQRTIIIDAISHSEVPDYLNCMDILVVPSTTVANWKEQFGRIIVEGMACKVPVIGSDSGEIPKTIGKAGLIFKEKDVTDLRKKIESLIDNRNLRAMLAENGRERVLENFTWKVIAERQYQAYKALMGLDK